MMQAVQLDKLQTIILGCIDNNRSDQEKLYSIFYPRVLKIAMKFSNDKFQAEDIASMSFLKCFQNISKYTFVGSFEGWLRKITIRTALDSIRINEKYNSQTLYIEKGEFISTNAISDSFHYKELIKAVESLPKTIKDVFNLNTVEGYSHKKIGSILGISESMSKWYLNKGRNILKQKIKHII